MTTRGKLNKKIKKKNNYYFLIKKEKRKWWLPVGVVHHPQPDLGVARSLSHLWG
jgi:hypothetical protein